MIRMMGRALVDSRGRLVRGTDERKPRQQAGGSEWTVSRVEDAGRADSCLLSNLSDGGA